MQTNILVSTKTRFFQEASGEYYLGVYVIDDGIVAPQANQGNMAEHKRLVRVSLTDSDFGDLIGSGNISAGAEQTQQYSIPINAAWDLAKLEIATIIWKKEGNTYVFENTNSTTEIALATNTNDLEQSNFAMQVRPNISANNMTIQLELVQNTTNLNLQLVDQLGRRVAEVFSGDLTLGVHTFEINRNLVSAAGTYLLVLNNDEEIKTQKVIFK